MNDIIGSVRRLTIALLLAIAVLGVAPRPLIAQDAALTAEAQQALTAVFEALRSGDQNKVRPLLAPEFQVVRSDGAAYNKEQYLKRSIPKIVGTFSFDDLVVTRNAEIVVTRMRLKIQERVDGKQAENGAPQLIIFRITPQGWQVVAAANFARLKK